MSAFTGQLPNIPSQPATPPLPTSASPVTGTSYVARAINVTITLGQGTFGQTGFNTVKLIGLRVAASIQKAGFPSQDNASVQVYGVEESLMNQVTTLGIHQIVQSRNQNAVIIEAGDAVNGMSIVHQGFIVDAFEDFTGSPETFLQITSVGGYIPAMQPVAPTSFPAGADAATMMQVLAGKAGWTFENNGVQVILPPTYLPGTYLDQMHTVARAANIEMYQDTGTTPPTLAIWPKNLTRVQNGIIPLVNKASGLINYPSFYSEGVSFRCLYNPNLTIAKQVQLQSSAGAKAPLLGQAGASPSGTFSGGPNGIWVIVKLSYDLSAQIPDGPWFCDADCAVTNIPAA